MHESITRPLTILGVCAPRPRTWEEKFGVQRTDAYLAPGRVCFSSCFRNEPRFGSFFVAFFCQVSNEGAFELEGREPSPTDGGLFVESGVENLVPPCTFALIAYVRLSGLVLAPFEVAVQGQHCICRCGSIQKLQCVDSAVEMKRPAEAVKA